MATAIPPGTLPGKIDVMLDPPELGRIDIVIELAEQTLRATLSAERTGTGELIRRHLDVLSEQFRAAGFADVDLSYSESGGHGAGTRQHADPHFARQDDDRPPSVRQRAATPPSVTATHVDIRL